MNLESVGNDSRANDIAKKLGLRDGAHQLKEEAGVRKSEMSLYDIKYDTKTRKIYVVRKDRSGSPIDTYLTMPSGY